jgi:hypothetical protein
VKRLRDTEEEISIIKALLVLSSDKNVALAVLENNE